MTKIAIVYYSLYGHVVTMAEAVKKGIEAGGATCDILQIPETLSEDILKAMHAPPKADYPIVTAAQLTDYDGFIFGISGRFGSMPAQMKVKYLFSVPVHRIVAKNTHHSLFSTMRILVSLYATKLKRLLYTNIDLYGFYWIPLDEGCPRWQVLWNLCFRRYPWRRTGDLQRGMLQFCCPPRHGLCSFGICGTQGLYL